MVLARYPKKGQSDGIAKKDEDLMKNSAFAQFPILIIKCTFDYEVALDDDACGKSTPREVLLHLWKKSIFQHRQYLFDPYHMQLYIYIFL